MKRKLAKMTRVAQAIALATLISVPAAHATVVDWGVHDLFESTQQSVPVGLFADYFTFTLPTFNDLTSVAVANNLTTSTLISSGKVTLFEGTQGDATADVSKLQYEFDGESGSVSHLVTGLTGGPFYYEVTGIASGTVGGQYQLASSLTPVTPVPEPEIYAMMGIGLGLMGFVARRRRRIS